MIFYLLFKGTKWTSVEIRCILNIAVERHKAKSTTAKELPPKQMLPLLSSHEALTHFISEILDNELDREKMKSKHSKLIGEEINSIYH